MVMDYVFAFVCGGLLCIIAQILIDKTKLTPARILVGFVVSGVFLGAVGVYKPFVEFAGSGAMTPLSGFGYLISKGVAEDVDSGGSGCGCSAVMLSAHFLPMLERKEIKKIIFIATGAMMSPMTLLQGEAIPSVAHLLDAIKAVSTVKGSRPGRIRQVTQEMPNKTGIIPN